MGLSAGAGRKDYLILRNLQVHHSKPVKAWLAEHKNQIEVFYLPSYSPELNPDEMANADLKQAVTKLALARTKLQLVKAAARQLRSVQRQPDNVVLRGIATQTPEAVWPARGLDGLGALVLGTEMLAELRQRHAVLELDEIECRDLDSGWGRCQGYRSGSSPSELPEAGY